MNWKNVRSYWEMRHLILAIAICGASFPVTSRADSASEASLLKLANKRFDNGISPAEQSLFKAVANGTDFEAPADMAIEDDSNDLKARSAKVIRADRLAWLCTDPVAATSVGHYGVSIIGSTIEGDLNLDWATIHFPLSFTQCVFTNNVTLNHSRLRALCLDGTQMKGLQADGLSVEGDVSCTTGFRSDGEIEIPYALIGGNLDFSGGDIINSNGDALSAAGAKIHGDVFLSTNFNAAGRVNLMSVEVGGDLDCHGGHFAATNSNNYALDADAAKVGGYLLLRNGFDAEGGVSLLSATIGKDLDCGGGHFVYRGTNIYALNAARAGIEGSVFLSDGFKAEGEVTLASVKIGKNLECNNGYFIHTNDAGRALTVYGAKVEGSVLFSPHFEAEGRVSLDGAVVSGTLNCFGGKFTCNNSNDYALDADGAKIGGYVQLSGGFKAIGGVNLYSATVGENLECDNGNFTYKGTNGYALSAESLRVGGDVFLRYDFNAKGGVNLMNSVIGQTLDCRQGDFVAVDALQASGAMIGGGVLLSSGFHSDGNVQFSGATIRGDFNCSGGHFINSNSVALYADGMKVDGYVRLDSAIAAGEITFEGAAISKDFSCSGGSFFNTNYDSDALNIFGAHVEGSLNLNYGFKSDGFVDLRSAVVGELRDETNCWPNAGNLLIDGFTYNKFGDRVVTDGKNRICWLGLQQKGDFFPQPYEQLAAVLRGMGHNEEAAEVMIAKNEDYASRLHWYSSARLWYNLIGKLADYGYRPGKAFKISLCFVFFGWIVFLLGVRSSIIKVVDKEKAYRKDGPGDKLTESYPRFHAFIYSLETFVPLLKLGMADFWRPVSESDQPFQLKIPQFPFFKKEPRLVNLSKRAGKFLCWYLWLHIIAGWVLTTLWVGGLTGLIKT